MLYRRIASWSLFISSLLDRHSFHFVFLTALSSVVLFAKLHQGDLNGFDDAIYAHEGKTMLMSGDWWNVWLNGKPDFDKPPMFVWLEALSMLVFGVSDFAARFPSALLGVGTIMLIYFLARELSDDHWLPALSMTILMTTHFFIKLAMHAMTDVTFTFFFTLAIYFYFKGIRRPLHFLFCGFAISLMIFTRSIIGIIPLVIILLHLMFIGRWDLIRSRYLLGCFLIALGLPMVWFISQYQTYGNDFLILHFSYSLENLPRSEGKSIPQIIFGLLHYPVLLFKNYWPWLPFMIVGSWMQLRRMLSGRDVASSLLVIWVVSIVLPFSLVEAKTLRYLLPAFPAFTILAGISLNRVVPAQRKIQSFKIAYAGLICLALILAVVPKYRLRLEEMRRLAPIVESSISPKHRVLLYTYGKSHWDYLHQVIWYTNRGCEMITDIGHMVSRVGEAEEAVIILDKETFRKEAGKLGDGMQILGESENFICIGKKSPWKEERIQQTRNNIVTQTK